MFLAFALVALACGGEEKETPPPASEDPHKALLPQECRIPRQGAECKACVADCCARCHPGSECIRFRACIRSCGGHLLCIRDCAESHPDGELDAIEAEVCPELDCADLC